MKRLAIAALALLVVTAELFAQGSTTGRLVGTVSSAAGVIPNATVTVTDNQTGSVRTVVTSGEGVFTIPQLDIGTYTVAITATGYKAYTATDVKIDTGREYSLNALLEVGNINEEVTVVAGADTVNSTNAELSNTVSTRQIVELPLAGRDALNLIQLQAGTASNGAQNTVINGQRSSFTNLTRDGINIQDNFIRANAVDFSPARPSADDIAEFTVTTQNAGADRGYGASQVNAVTPRGSSEFHGALFAYNRNSEFAANNFFNNATGVDRPFLNRNQFGGKVGGPLPFFNFGEGGPVFLKDKAFFFIYYEGLRERTSSSRTRTILTPSARQGIFRYTDNAGVLREVNLFDPRFNTGITGINPIILNRFIANTPTQGNTTVVGDSTPSRQLNTTGYRFTQAANNDRDTLTMRYDFEINSSNSLNFVFNRADEVTLRPDIDSNQGFDKIPSSSDAGATNLYVAAWRTTPAATFTNELRAGFLDSFPSFSRSAPTPSEFYTGTGGSQLAGLISTPEVAFLPQGRETKTYNLQDNAEYIRGDHSFRFGALAQLFRVNRLNSAGIVPTYTLGVNANTPQITTAQFGNATLFPGGISTTQRSRANSLLALLGGIVSSATQTFNVTGPNSGFVPGAGLSQNYKHENYAFYFNDQWRVSPRLTLNLGLRYEIFTGLRETNGVVLEPNIPAGSTVEQALLNPNGFTQIAGSNLGNSRLFENDTNNLGPVLSFAYSPQFRNRVLGGVFPGGGRTVIRGGFRVSYVNDELLRGTANQSDRNAGLRGGRTLSNLNARVGGAPPVEPPPLTLPRSYQLNNQLAANLGDLAGIVPDIQIPRTEEWNIGIQREIGFQTAIEIRYVHGRSNNLWRYIDLNQLDITSNGFLNDFFRAQQNLALSGGVSAAYNPNIPGSQQLPVISRLTNTGGAALNNATVLSFIREGRPGSLAQNYISLGLTNGFPFFPNPNAGRLLLLGNNSFYRYNALQTEIRRRFSQGLYFQANYTWQKTLTDSTGGGQTRQDPRIDNSRPNLEFGRADFDQAHVFNLNGIYELPFGQGKPFLSEGSWVNRLVGGFQLSSIMNISSGAPFTILDPRSTLNRTAPSVNQTANSSLSREEIQSLFGVRRLSDGRILFVDPSVLSPTGAATNGPGEAPFSGQVFFNVPAGQTGNIERGLINGPLYFNIDASLIKNIQITENTRIQLRAEAFNLLNHTNFFIGNTDEINSTTFGEIGSAFAPRRMQFAVRFEF